MSIIHLEYAGPMSPEEQAVEDALNMLSDLDATTEADWTEADRIMARDDIGYRTKSWLLGVILVAVQFRKV